LGFREQIYNYQNYMDDSNSLNKTSLKQLLTFTLIFKYQNIIHQNKLYKTNDFTLFYIRSF